MKQRLSLWWFYPVVEWYSVLGLEIDGDDKLMASVKIIFNSYARISINAVSLSTISLIAFQESHALVIAVTAVWKMLFVYDRNINEVSDVLFIT